MKDKCKIVMTNRYSITRRITLLLVILSLNITLLYGTENIWVQPFQIMFNYEGGQSNDALTICKADGTAISAAEWCYSYDEDEIENFAYLKSQSNRKIKVSFDSNCEDMHLIIRLTVTSGTGIGEICNFFVCNYHKLDWVTLTLSGTLPGTVGRRTFTWEWEIYGIPINDPDFCAAWETTETTHTWYTLLTTPQAPMAEPWSSVLDYACDWASGQSTAAGVAQKATEGIYYMGDTDGDIDYDWPLGGSVYSFGDYHREFNLDVFFSDISVRNDVEVNCYDVANLFNIFTVALGLNSYSKIIKKDNVLATFYTNQIDPIGTANSWSIAEWNNHQFGWYNNSVNDPCLRVNHSDPILPVNMEQEDYDDCLLAPDNDYDSSNIGVVTIRGN